MKTFFQPKAWNSKLEAVTFRPITDLVSAVRTPVRKNKKRTRARKNKPEAQETRTETNQPDPSMEVLVTRGSSSGKVRSGRVGKKRGNQKQLRKLTPSQLKAAADAIVETDATPSTSNATASTATATATAQPSLAQRLKEKLLGGRFRFLNQLLYTMDSGSAERLFKEDGDAYSAYHEGYRHQVSGWPFNPLDRIIKMVRGLPKSMVIVDFGCGDGLLAKSVPNKVYSLDLVSTRPDIIACDMANTPLQPQSVDVAVYCLSLMGTNLRDYLLEANRVLRIGGQVYIADIQSRFEDERSFVRGLEACGFQLLKRDISRKLFYFFQFKKIRNVGKVAVLPAFTLKPCLYRKR